MNPLHQALLEIIGNDNGFEHLLSATTEAILSKLRTAPLEL